MLKYKATCLLQFRLGEEQLSIHYLSIVCNMLSNPPNLYLSINTRHTYTILNTQHPVSVCPLPGTWYTCAILSTQYQVPIIPVLYKVSSTRHAIQGVPAAKICLHPPCPYTVIPLLYLPIYLS